MAGADYFLELLSQFLGWVYFLAWSFSFYPQTVLNYNRKSTSGTTVDFPLINTLGFLAYSASNIAFYYSPLIQAQYGARHHGLTPTVQFNDITFALHGLVLCIICTSQYLFPRSWGFTPSPASSKPSRAILGIGLGSILGVVLIVLLVAASPDRDSIDGAVHGWAWLDAVYAVSYVKLLVTLVKYTPQVLVNYRNQSTVGWSITMILLDFGGGILSIVQQGIDSYMQRDWSGITGNPVKFALGNVSLTYDAIFMAQHYVLYPDAEEKEVDAERETLLRRRREDDVERRID